MGRVFSCMLSSDAGVGGVGITEDGAPAWVTMTTRHAPNYFWSNKLNKRGPERNVARNQGRVSACICVSKGFGLYFGQLNLINSCLLLYILLSESSYDFSLKCSVKVSHISYIGLFETCVYAADCNWMVHIPRNESWEQREGADRVLLRVK